MGLDVYLYRCKDRAYAKQQEEAYETATVGVGYGDDERAPFMECFAMADKFGTHTSVVKVEEPSAKHSDHIFKVGYFRSSYNNGGFDSYARRMGIPTLGEIMGFQDDYEFTPDWAASKARAEDALRRIGAVDDGYDAFCVSPNPFLPAAIDSEKEALAAFRSVLNKNRPGSDPLRSFSTRSGTFFLDGRPVYALLPGVSESIGRKQPCVYAVTKREASDDNWYAQALEIVIETCDYAINSGSPQEFYLRWSG
jgi:hypothetical protein